jgi:hypothetical protein
MSMTCAGPGSGGGVGGAAVAASVDRVVGAVSEGSAVACDPGPTVQAAAKAPITHTTLDRIFIVVLQREPSRPMSN